MYCTECGKDLPASVRFCRHCGAPAPAAGQSDAPSAPSAPGVASVQAVPGATPRPAENIESPPPLPSRPAPAFALPPLPAAGVPAAEGMMKVDWQNWDAGGRVIFIATCVAAASMLLNWVAFGVLSSTGLSQGAFLLLGCYVYPLLRLLKNQSIHNGWGVGCSALAVVLVLGYIGSKQVSLFGRSVNGAAGGAYLFLLASVALGVGVVRYASARRARGLD